MSSKTACALPDFKRDLLAELVEALFKNGRRYNLLNSAILECFKYIKDENIKTLINYVMENYWNKLKLIKYTNLFDQMKEKYDANTAEQVCKQNIGLGSYYIFSIVVKVVPTVHLEWVGGFGMTPAR